MKFDVKFRDLVEIREIFHKSLRQYLGLVCPSSEGHHSCQVSQVSKNSLQTLT